jgi:hypothetical protein
MSTDAGSAAAPEDAATRGVASERPGLESADPGSADSGTSTPQTADRGVDGSAPSDSAADLDTDAGAGGATGADTEGSSADAGTASSGSGAGSGVSGSGAVSGVSGSGSGTGTADAGNPADEGFVAGMLRDATITGLPGETGAPPAEPHAPQAQQEGNEPVGSEPPAGDNPRGVD